MADRKSMTSQTHLWQAVSTHNLKTSGRTWMFSTAILSETFFVWLRVAVEIWFESYSCTTWDMHRSFSDTTLCACTASPYTHRYLVRNHAWQQNSRTLWLHATHQMMALLPTMHRFRRTYLASYTTCCSVFSLADIHLSISIIRVCSCEGSSLFRNAFHSM